VKIGSLKQETQEG